MQTDGPAQPTPARCPHAGIFLALVGVILIVLLRLAGPWDVLDNDQLRPHAYVQDIVRNNHWLVQHDWTGEVASKPPLYAWLGALPALLSNRVGPLELAIPSALGVAIGAIAIAIAGARTLGPRAACLAVLAFLATPIIIKQTTLARTDALFAGLTTAAAFLALRAWTARRGWWEFWLVASLATLTKGPLALVLALAGLILIRRDRSPRGDSPRPEWPEHALGAVAFLAITCGWLAAAWIHEGQPFIDKTFGRELLGHVTGASKEHLRQFTPLERVLEWVVGLFKPSLYLLYHAAPWSIAAVLGLVRTFRSPHPDPARRVVERFCAGWLIVGLAIFSVVPHQRADLLSPIWAPGAMLAASFLADHINSWRARRARLAACGAMLAIAGFVISVYWIASRRSDTMKRDAHIRDAYREAVALGLPPAMITPLDGPYFFTALCNVLPERVTIDQAARLLAGDAPAFISTRDPDALLDAARGVSGRSTFVIVRTPEISIVSNSRRLHATDSVVALHNGLLIETAGARMGPPRLGVLILETGGAGSAVLAIQNLSEAPRLVRWRARGGPSGRLDLPPFTERLVTLEPGGER